MSEERDQPRQGLTATAAPPAVAWPDGRTPADPAFDDTYFSAADGRRESEAVFLAGNGLPDRWRDRAAGASPFQIAELGFGTGLNAVLTAEAWQTAATAGAQLAYTAFEAFPMAPDDMVRAFAPWPDLAGHAAALAAHLPVLGQGEPVALAPGLTLQLVVGDARLTLPAWSGRADAWFLDGFAPARNPELWGADLMAAVFAHTAPGGTFSTYTAAGWVRRNLVGAGFEVERVPGHPPKRERLQGRKPVA